MEKNHLKSINLEEVNIRKPLSHLWPASSNHLSIFNTPNESLFESKHKTIIMNFDCLFGFFPLQHLSIDDEHVGVVLEGRQQLLSDASLPERVEYDCAGLGAVVRGCGRCASVLQRERVAELDGEGDAVVRVAGRVDVLALRRTLAPLNRNTHSWDMVRVMMVVMMVVTMLMMKMLMLQ